MGIRHSRRSKADKEAGETALRFGNQTRLCPRVGQLQNP